MAFNECFPFVGVDDGSHLFFLKGIKNIKFRLHLVPAFVFISGHGCIEAEPN